jgi:RNA polymerase sigma-70 factor (ECF subfamily)
MVERRGFAPRVSSFDPARDELRLRSMVDLHYDSVWRAVKRLGVSVGDVDDAAQKVFVTAARKLAEIEVGRERQYLLGIALRVSADARRARRRRAEVSIEAVEDAVVAPDELIDEKRSCEVLARILQGLPAELREAFVLFELEEVSAPAVAELLKIPIGTVASRVRRARTAIRAQLRRRTREPVWRAGSEL